MKRKDKKIPIGLKSLNKAEKRGYFSISKNSESTKKLAYLVGYNLGDGNIHYKLCNTWFYGHSDDLPKLNSLLKPFSVQGQIHIYKIHNGKMCISDNAFTRFMISLGCVIGDKTKSSFSIPKWIMDTKKGSEIKRKFLQGLCDSELMGLKLIKTRRFAFQSLKFYSIKTKDLVKEGKEYLNQIRNLLLEFDIVSGEEKIDRLYIRSRDNSQMIQLYFTVHSNYINLNNFIHNVGFLYNKKRKERIEQYKEKIEFHAKKELEKIEKYKKAIVLRKKGFSAYKIAEKLNLPIHYAKSWLYKDRKPMSRFYSLKG